MAERTKPPEPWWLEPDRDRARAKMYDVLTQMDARQKGRRAMNGFNMRLYIGQESMGPGGSTISRAPWGYNQGRLSYNLVSSVIDTACAKIAKNKPRPKFLTSGGDWSLKMKAKKLQRFVDGEFYRLKIHGLLGLTAFRHACIFNTGFLHIFQEQNKVQAEWVFPDEARCDENEAIYGSPRTLYRYKTVDKYVLAAKFPDHKDKIMSAPAPKETDFLFYKHTENLVQVVEAWHLRSPLEEEPNEAADEEESEEALEKNVEEAEPGGYDEEPDEDETEESCPCDGRHTITIDGATLVDEHYHRDEYPLIKINWQDAVLGYWGIGLAYILTPLQVELNKVLKRIQDCIHRASVTRIFVETGSQVVDSHIGNLPAAIVHYTGQAPVIDSSNTIPRELFDHVAWCIQSAYQLAGISQLSAQSQKPQGLDSGKALREFSDIESERFILQGQAWEQFHIQIARHIVWNAKDIAKREGDYEAQWPDKRSFMNIKWSEIDLEEDQYMMQIFPTSSLSQTPAGRLADVADMMNLGLLGDDKAEVMELLNFPDLESDTNVTLAAYRDIERTVEKILEDGDYEAPDATQNLALGVKRMTLAYLQSKDDGAPQENLNLALQWIAEAKNILAPPPPPAPPAAAGPPAPPPGPPGPGAPMPMPPPNPAPGPMPAPQPMGAAA